MKTTQEQASQEIEIPPKLAIKIAKLKAESALIQARVEGYIESILIVNQVDLNHRVRLSKDQSKLLVFPPAEETKP